MSTEAGLASIATGGVTPRVSVIVPTRNRAPYLRELLNALSFQVYPADKMEIIVVDNSSTDDTEEVVKQAAASFSCPVRFHRKHNDGPAASRNRGAELAGGEILAFTDSDCLPLPGWVAAGVAAFEDGVAVVCGPVRADAITREHPFFIHQIHPVEGEEGLYPTANVFYRRDVFLAAGGFDEQLRTYAWGQPVGGDDTELAWRLRRLGHRSAFARGAVVLHQATPTSAREYMLGSIQVQAIPRLVANFPELRKTCLFKNYFLHKQSAYFDLLLAGVALTPATPWTATLALPWLNSIWPSVKHDLWPPKYWGRATARLALRVEAALLLWATLMFSSLKNRTPVL